MYPMPADARQVRGRYSHSATQFKTIGRPIIEHVICATNKFDPFSYVAEFRMLQRLGRHGHGRKTMLISDSLKRDPISP